MLTDAIKRHTERCGIVALPDFRIGGRTTQIGPITDFQDYYPNTTTPGEIHLVQIRLLSLIFYFVTSSGKPYLNFAESENCVVLTFERDDLHSDGNVSVVGVDCTSVEHAKVVCEIKMGKLNVVDCYTWGVSFMSSKPRIVIKFVCITYQSDLNRFGETI